MLMDCPRSTIVGAVLVAVLLLATGATTTLAADGGMTSVADAQTCFSAIQAMLENSNSTDVQQAVESNGLQHLGLGNYHGCVARSTYHYCLMNATVLDVPAVISSLTDRIGLCVPSQCSSVDLVDVIPVLITMSGFKLNLTVNSIRCLHRKPFSNAAIVSLTVFGLIITLVLAGTLLGWIHRIREEREKQAESDMIDDPSEPIIAKYNTNRADRKSTVPTSGSAYDIPDDLVRQSSRFSLDEHRPLLHVNAVQQPARRRTPIFVKFLLSFDAVRNMGKLLAPSPGAPELRILNGVRVISMMWIILGHTTFYMTGAGLDNPLYVLNSLFRTIGFQIPMPSGNLAVDTFFFLSAFLASMAMRDFLIKQQQRAAAKSLAISESTAKRRSALQFCKSIPLMYINRYLRLTPLYGLAILFLTTVFPYLSSGPLWQWYGPVDPYDPIATCGKYWWTNLVYVNNFYPHEYGQQCFGWGWYLANDWQFFLIAPFLVVFVYSHRRIGYAVLTFLTLFSTALNGILIYVDNLEFCPTDTEKTSKFFNDLYERPYTRATPFLLGMLVMFVYMEYKAEIARFYSRTVWIRIIGFTFALFCIGACVFGTAAIFAEPADYVRTHKCAMSTLASWFYLTFFRFGFILGVAFVVLTCLVGYGGILTTFFGFEFWTPFARLTYAAYLLHPILILYLYHSGNIGMDFTGSLVASLYIGNASLTWVLATILFLAIEKPVMNLVSMMLPSGRGKTGERGSSGNGKTSS